jgi:hypothetical protein
MYLKANPEEMESEAEHWEVPKDDAIVKLVKGRKKQHKDLKLAAGRCRDPKELTAGDCGFRRKFGCLLRVDAPSCSSGMAQENWEDTF